MLTRLVVQRLVAHDTTPVVVPVDTTVTYRRGDILAGGIATVVDAVPFLVGHVGNSTVVVVVDIAPVPLTPPVVEPIDRKTTNGPCHETSLQDALCLVSSLARPIGVLTTINRRARKLTLKTQSITATTDADNTLRLNSLTLRSCGIMTGQTVRLNNERFASVQLDEAVPNDEALITETLHFNVGDKSEISVEPTLGVGAPPLISATLRPLSLGDFHSASTPLAASHSLQVYVEGQGGWCFLHAKDIIALPVCLPSHELSAVLEVQLASVRDALQHQGGSSRWLYYFVEDCSPEGGGRFDVATSVMTVGSPMASPRDTLPRIAPPKPLRALPPYVSVAEAISASTDSPVLVLGTEENYVSEMCLAAVRASGHNAISVHMGLTFSSAMGSQEILAGLRKMLLADPATWFVFHHVDVNASISRALAAEIPRCIVCIEGRECPLTISNDYAVVVKVENPTEAERAAWIGTCLRHRNLSVTFQTETAAAVTTAMSYKDIACVVSLIDDEVVSQEAFLAAARTHSETIGVRLTSTRIDPVLWKDVGGLAKAKSYILEMVQLPLQYPHLYKNVKKRSGVLFYGPPGCGKTLLAKAIATECKLNFMSVKGPELLNMYVGESEKNVRETFRQAREASPCVLFFDELDALAPARGAKGDSGGVMDRIVSQLLTELDGAATQPGTTPGASTPFVFVIGATNRPDLLDQSLLRPGRFDASCYLGLPMTREDQLATVQALLRKFQFGEDVDVAACVSKIPLGVFTAADYYGMASDAIMRAVEETGSLVVHQRHLEAARDHLSPSLSPEEIEKYTRMNV